MRQLNLCRIFTHITVKHLLAILLSVFSAGYKGKTVNFEKHSPHHRTTIAHFLNQGRWDDALLADTLKAVVVQAIYSQAIQTGCPIFCIVDDTISSKTRPSSRPLHPIEDAYFHQSHLKKKQDYGHQAVAVMLSCNGLVLNYAVAMYDKTKSKVEVVREIAGELPEAPTVSYLLCDSWYTNAKIMDAFLKKGFYTVGALKTNRVLYPCGIRCRLSSFASCIRQADCDVRLVTAGKRQYYVYRYEGKLNGLENAVVLISYPKEAFGQPKALRAFFSTDVSLSIQEILDAYVERWPIELFFRSSKNRLALDKYQVRSSQGIRRYWLIMSMAHYLCCQAGDGCFEDGYAYFQRKIQEEQVLFVYQCGLKHLPLESVLALVG